jgi:uncharacterized protein (TIGR03435 family)
MRRVRHFVCAAVYISFATMVAAQAPDPSKPVPVQAQDASASQLAYDAVSIKPHQDEGLKMRIGMTETPDGFTAGGLPLRLLIREAFNLPEDRLLNEPEWTKTARYDMEAKVAPEDAPRLKALTQAERNAMLLPVLEDRCGLKFHRETRELEVYALVAAKGGPKLHSSEAPHAELNQPGQFEGSVGISLSDRGIKLTAHRATMESLARTISSQVGSTVIDKTGLTGDYDYTLEYAPENGMGPGMPPIGSGGGSASSETEAPSIFTALQEQLGLKLEARKEPVEVVVIDSIEPPTTN